MLPGYTAPHIPRYQGLIPRWRRKPWAKTLAWPRLTHHVALPRPPRGHALACHVVLVEAPPGNAKVLASLHLCFLPY